MSVQDPVSTYHPDNLQQTEDIPDNAVIGVLVVSGVVTVVCIFIAWVFLIYCYGEVRPNRSIYDYPERFYGPVAGIEDLPIEQEYFSLPVQPGEEVRKEQVKALHGFGKSTADTGAPAAADTVHIPISEAKKLFIQQQGKAEK
jgi:hypothetical protein